MTRTTLLCKFNQIVIISKNFIINVNFTISSIKDFYILNKKKNVYIIFCHDILLFRLVI